MSSGLICSKVGMSRIFTEGGDVVPVTYLKVEPNTVVRCKTEDKDGYNAVVLGTRAKTVKTRKGNEFTKYRTEKEWRVDDASQFAPGMQLTVGVLPKEEEKLEVTITGVSKGRGFQGVIKRHGFSRGPETHGSHHHRRPGSVGMCEFPGRVLKGKKMPGRMGTDTVTLRDRSIVEYDPEEGLIAIKGAIPGPNGGTVFITFQFEPDFSALSGGAAPVADEPKEEKKEEATEAPAEEAKEEAKEEAAEEAPESDSDKSA